MSVNVYGFRRYTVCTDIGFAEYENRRECLVCHYDVSIEGYAPYCTTRRHREGCLLAARFDTLIEALRDDGCHIRVAMKSEEAQCNEPE